MPEVMEQVRVHKCIHANDYHLRSVENSSWFHKIVRSHLGKYLQSFRRKKKLFIFHRFEVYFPKTNTKNKNVQRIWLLAFDQQHKCISMVHYIYPVSQCQATEKKNIFNIYELIGCDRLRVEHSLSIFRAQKFRLQKINSVSWFYISML